MGGREGSGRKGGSGREGSEWEGGEGVGGGREWEGRVGGWEGGREAEGDWDEIRNEGVRSHLSNQTGLIIPPGQGRRG